MKIQIQVHVDINVDINRDVSIDIVGWVYEDIEMPMEMYVDTYKYM